MPDIAMCLNNECPKRNDCYRYRAVANEYQQSYGPFKPDDDGECKKFIDIADCYYRIRPIS